VLAGAAGAGAASLLEPVAGLADALKRPPPVFSRWVGSLAGQSPPLQSPRRFALVGVEWKAPAAARIELRARRDRGAWSPWAPASTLGHDPDRPIGARSLFGEPIWTGPADYVQLRTSRPLSGVRLYFVASPAQAMAHEAAALPLATPVLDAGPGQPPIIARVGWAQGQAPHTPPEYGTVKLAFVHHTVNPNGYSPADVPAMLLAIFQYHRYVRGYHDIAYNFIIDLFGRIWEARAGGIDLPVMGAHAGGYNQESTGVAILGDFMDVVPSPAAIDALEHLLAWKLSLHGLPTLGRATVVVSPDAYLFTPFGPGALVALPRIAGHRDGDLTDCPGNALYDELASIRPVVHALAGRPAALTLAGAPSSSKLAGATIALSGRLTTLSGGPLAGEPIELQQVAAGAEQTIARATTGADGGWSETVTLSHNAILRALHRPAPATTSELAGIGVAPVVTLSVVADSPVRVSGTVSPAKRNVTIDAYALVSGHRQLRAHKTVAVVRGQFSAKVPLRRAGRYLLIARTSADASNVAGASQAVTVTV